MLTTRKFDRAKAAEGAAYQRYCHALDSLYAANNRLSDALLAALKAEDAEQFAANHVAYDAEVDVRAAHQAVADALQAVEAAKAAMIAAYYSKEPDRAYPT